MIVNFELNDQEIFFLADYLKQCGVDSDNSMVLKLHQKFEDRVEAFKEAERIIKEEAPYPLSENERLFVHDLVRLDLTIDWEYSGRGMMGKRSPSTVMSNPKIETSAKVEVDSMGHDYVIYCRR